MSEYRLSDYGSMIQDRIRTDAYAEAINVAVKPGSVVLDIGTGTGVFALLAARAGARKVIAVESSELIQVARETAAANGLESTIEFVHGLSTDLDLSEPADVIVSDLHGVLPLYSGLIPSIVDARTRLLAPGGVLIPCRDSLWACPIESAEEYEHHVASWNRRPYGLDLGAASPIAKNNWWKAGDAGKPLAPGECLGALNYLQIESPNVSSSVHWSADRDGALSGFLVWFDSQLHGDIGFTNAPDAPRMVFGRGFFPVDEPVELRTGDEISLDFSASLVGGEYVFRWKTRVADSSTPGALRADFMQSTLFSFPLTPERLTQLADDHKPKLTDAGEAVAFLLTHADGDRTLGELAAEMQVRHPSLFRSADEALRFVTHITQEHCR
jgi:type I protein arginine methyltransferase